MNKWAPGFDPQAPWSRHQRDHKAERDYMGRGDGDSEERLFVALGAAINSAPSQGTLETHSRLQPETEDGPEEDGSVILEDDTPWFCPACNEYVGTGKDFEVIVSTHQSHMVRRLLLGYTAPARIPS